MACVNTRPLPCGCFVYLVFMTPTQSVPTHKPVRQVCLTSILQKENWLQLVGQAQLPVFPTLANSRRPGQPLHYPSHESKRGKKAGPGNLFGGAMPVHRSKQVILYSSSSILPRSKEDEGTSAILFLVDLYGPFLAAVSFFQVLMLLVLHSLRYPTIFAPITAQSCPASSLSC